MKTLADRYKGKIRGVLSCFDRILLQATLSDLCHPAGMRAMLQSRGLQPTDFAGFFKPLTEQIRENALELAAKARCHIEFVRRRDAPKEKLVQKVLEERGDHPGLVHVLTAMETCTTFRVGRDGGGKPTLYPSTGKCLHYYFYFIDESLGLCFLRVPTWAPFRLQFYFNGHNQLARKLKKAGIHFEMIDNAFLEIDDIDAAQRLADDIDTNKLVARLNRYARLFCPPAVALSQYNWTISQAEYSTDIIFRRQADLQPIYECLTRTAIQAVKPDDVATFLGRKLACNYQGAMGNDFSTRIEGTRIKHYMGQASIKMYDKAGIILRIETTVNNISFFRTKRTVNQRDGKVVWRVAPLKKSVHSLKDLRKLMSAANRRYLEFLSALDDTTSGAKALGKISKRVVRAGRAYRGLNLFLAEDLAVLKVLARGEFTISGLQNKDLRRFLPEKKPAWVSRCIKRLREHGLLKSVAGRYKYFLTALGKRVIAAGLIIREMSIVRALSTSTS